ncbi:MAG: Lipopolysaccharide heptosyltransferase I (EC [uncultured Campylobacterales bacterium]|uniref:Lipopolysaccharide heptosyltransferase 1 n=1 Tax=uncultured Campylobacterales bacterium TaxID=352960 RepID=A0A6S6SCX8_9BACT|nr:MAG: Lipopolysaccharide heptosyltransferase I (EC [uncultured Campylobacterales bacterium]
MKIVIIKTSALGDILHTSFILQFIKSHIPNAHISWVIESRFAGILSNHKDIDELITINTKNKSIKNILKTIKDLRALKKQNNYDIAIDFQGLLKSAITSKILCKNNNGYDKNSIREKVASYLYKNSFDIAYHSNTIDRYRELLNKSLNINVSKEDVLAKKNSCFYSQESTNSIKPFLSDEKKNIIFIVGSTWESRIYPKERFLNIAKNLENTNILVPYGNTEEKKFGEYLQRNSHNVKVLPKLSLDKLKAIISSADLLIGNDTGPSYIAWANNIPSITIFGPTPASRIYESNIHKLIKSSSIVDHYNLNKNDFSINEISEDKIIKIAQELLNQ